MHLTLKLCKHQLKIEYEFILSQRKTKGTEGTQPSYFRPPSHTAALKHSPRHITCIKLTGNDTIGHTQTNPPDLLVFPHLFCLQ